MSKSVAGAISESGIVGDVFEVESADRMAWVVLILRKLPDHARFFPRGKWSTIQHIEHQIDAAATGVANEYRHWKASGAGDKA